VKGFITSASTRPTSSRRDLAQGDALELLDAAPRAGLAGQIAFVHPKACCGVLVELATPSAPRLTCPSPVRLKRLVVGAATSVARATAPLAVRARRGRDERRSALDASRSVAGAVLESRRGSRRMEGLVALSMLR